MRRTAVRRDDRGVSTTVTYVTTIAVTTMLVTGLTIATGSMLESERERVVRNELGAVGERVTAELLAADDLARTGTALSVRVSHPARIAGTGYTVALRVGPPHCEGGACVVLNATDADISRTVPLPNRTAVAESSVRGGSFVVHYDPASDELRLEPGDGS